MRADAKKKGSTMTEYEGGIEVVSDSDALSSLPLIRNELNKLADGVLRHIEIAEQVEAGDKVAEFLMRRADFNLTICKALDKTMAAVAALADRVEYLLRSKGNKE
jgi:hypothetical protein